MSNGLLILFCIIILKYLGIIDRDDCAAIVPNCYWHPRVPCKLTKDYNAYPILALATDFVSSATCCPPHPSKWVVSLIFSLQFLHRDIKVFGLAAYIYKNGSDSVRSPFLRGKYCLEQGYNHLEWTWNTWKYGSCIRRLSAVWWGKGVLSTQHHRRRNFDSFLS